MDKKESEQIEKEETEEEKKRKACMIINSMCDQISNAMMSTLCDDVEYESLLTSLQAAEVEYDFLNKNLKRKRNTGELTWLSQKKLRRISKEIKRHREDLSNYLYYRDMNLLLLESPKSYACMLCGIKDPIDTEDGDTVCRFQIKEEDNE